MTQSAPIPVARSGINISLPAIVGLFVFATVLCWGQTVLLDPDTYLHIAIGRWILVHHAAPHVGIFSETMPNAPWVADEWLAQGIIGLLYTVWGWNGLVLAVAGSFALALALLTRYLLRWLEPVHALIGTISAAAMLMPHLLARPHVFTWPVMALWFGELVQAREYERAPSLWLLPLMTLWANLHGGFMFGLVFIGIFAGEAFILARTSAAKLAVTKRWGLFAILAVLASMITPYGIYTLWLPFHVMQMKFALAALAEWQSPNFQSIQIIEVWLVAALALTLVYGVRLPITRVAMVLLLLHMTLVHKRNADFLGFLTPLFIAPTIGPQLRNRISDQMPLLDRAFARLSRPTNLLGSIMALAALLIVSAGYLTYPLERRPDSNTPVAALQAARADHLVEGRVFNQYGFGDYLMFSGVEPFIDGRAELYGNAFFKRYMQAIWGVTDDLPKLLNEYRITWTMFSAGGTAAALMAHLPGWRRIYADNVAVVYARQKSREPD